MLGIKKAKCKMQSEKLPNRFAMLFYFLIPGSFDFAQDRVSPE